MSIKERVKEYKKELVLQKVAQLFESQGIEKIKMAEVAKQCGISVGALYKLFGSKDELFYEYVRFEMERFHQRLKEAFEHLSTPQERLLHYIRQLFATFIAKRRLLEDTLAVDPLFLAKLSLHERQALHPIYETIAQELAKLPNLRIAPLQAAILLKSHLYGYIEYWLLEGGELMNKSEEAYKTFIEGVGG